MTAEVQAYENKRLEVAWQCYLESLVQRADGKPAHFTDARMPDFNLQCDGMQLEKCAKFVAKSGFVGAFAFTDCDGTRWQVGVVTVAYQNTRWLAFKGDAMGELAYRMAERDAIAKASFMAERVGEVSLVEVSPTKEEVSHATPLLDVIFNLKLEPSSCLAAGDESNSATYSFKTKNPCGDKIEVWVVAKK